MIFEHLTGYLRELTGLPAGMMLGNLNRHVSAILAENETAHHVGVEIGVHIVDVPSAGSRVASEMQKPHPATEQRAHQQGVSELQMVIIYRSGP